MKESTETRLQRSWVNTHPSSWRSISHLLPTEQWQWKRLIRFRKPSPPLGASNSLQEIERVVFDVQTHSSAIVFFYLVRANRPKRLPDGRCEHCTSRLFENRKTQGVFFYLQNINEISLKLIDKMKLNNCWAKHLMLRVCERQIWLTTV